MIETAPYAGTIDPCTAAYPSFADAFDKLYPHFLQESRESKRGDLTLMQVKQSGHEKIIPPNPDIVFRIVTNSQLEHSSVDLGDGRKELSGHKGSFYIAPPDAVAEWHSEGNHSLLMMSVPKERVLNLLSEDDEIPEEDPLRALYGRDIFDASLSKSLERIWTEICGEKVGCGLRIESLFLNLLARLAELSEGKEPIEGSRPSAKLDQARLRRVTEYIDAHFGESITVKDLAEVACLSVHHFSRAFAATMRVSPYQYVTNRRIDASIDLLADKGLSLTDVALTCGFSSQSHFTTIFKEHLSTTPGHYRQELTS